MIEAAIEFSVDVFPEAPVRADDLLYVVQQVRLGRCCSIVGVSNTGKSILLRSLCHPEVESACSIDEEKRCLCVFTDLFATPRTEQYFCGWILHCIIDRLEELPLEEETIGLLRQWYQDIQAATTPLALRSAFHEAMEVLCGKWKVVLILDEIDDIYRDLNVDVLRYLVVLRDEFRERLNYVTATTHRLEELRAEPALDEFVEMFRSQVRLLQLLNEADTRRMIQYLARKLKVVFTGPEIAFVIQQAGGHPSLLEFTCEELAKEKTGKVEVDPVQFGRALQENRDIRDECQQIWDDLSQVEQETLRLLVTGPSLAPFASTGVRQLKEMGIIAERGEKPQLFGELFKTFVARQPVSSGAEGLQFDESTGEIRVDGVRISEDLTGLPYRLFVLLWRKQGGVCSKDEIAAALWPEAFEGGITGERIDDGAVQLRKEKGVTDEQIQKVASRLRKMIGKHLVTIRGRGYRLQMPSKTDKKRTSGTHPKRLR